MLDHGEPIPRSSKPDERSELEKELAKRAETEWDTRVDLSGVPMELRAVLRRALHRDPNQRFSSSELLAEIQNLLAEVTE